MYKYGQRCSQKSEQNRRIKKCHRLLISLKKNTIGNIRFIPKRKEGKSMGGMGILVMFVFVVKKLEHFKNMVAFVQHKKFQPHRDGQASVQSVTACPRKLFIVQAGK